MSARFSHAACTHPSNKVARAACRRSRAKLAGNPILAAVEAALKGPKMLMPAVVEVETVTVAEEITRENWREYKGRRAVVLTNDDEPTTRGEITGWSAKLIQIKALTGKKGETKLTRIPVENVVTVVTDNA